MSSELSNGKFVKNISIYPSLQLTLVHPDMTREFEEHDHSLARLISLKRASHIIYIIFSFKRGIIKKMNAVF